MTTTVRVFAEYIQAGRAVALIRVDASGAETPQGRLTNPLVIATVSVWDGSSILIREVPADAPPADA